MKTIKFLFFLTFSALLTNCGDPAISSETTDPGDITVDFTFSSDGSIFNFQNLSEGATSYKWDFGDLSFYCDKENPSYIYTRAGGDLEVTLTAINDSGNEASITKTITAPEIKNIDIAIDGDLSDWDEVDFLVDDSALANNMQILKVWGGGDNLNIYIEGNASMQLELLSIFIDTDGNENTGFGAWQWGAKSGADYLFQGPIGPLWWGDSYNSAFTDTIGFDWTWNRISGVEEFVSSNLINVDADTNAIEFSITKSSLGGDSLAETISLAFSELNSGWVDLVQIPESGADKAFVSYTFPIEASGLCE